MNDIGPNSLAGLLLRHLASKDRHKELIETEWSMGNGQCPICYGLGPSFERQERGEYGDPSKLGHKKDCLLSMALKVVRSEYYGNKKIT